MGVCVISVLFWACSKETSFQIFKNCNLPEDQSGSLSGFWPASPIPIAFNEGDFNSSELQVMAKAAAHWNEFFSKSKGFEIYDFGGDVNNPRTAPIPRPPSICNQGLITNGQFNGNVMIYKISSGWPYDDEIVALTSFCPVPGNPLPTIFNALIEVNYENFFTIGQKLPDLLSILLHELGHLVGLDHSCDTFSRNGIPLCSESPQEYIVAVMYAIVNFPNGINGEIKDVLTKNDQERGNCLPY